MTDEELRTATKCARAKASAVGPMHALWDVILDAEAILAGKQSLLSRKQVEEILQKE
ncbi:hypothetical protein [Hyphomicrobium sp.]|uniref:hypothetical protein n=1 Tax=Hyphomicrobium sp. TaxID=82 RepID=UPI001DDEAC22|nr:hypothetical protein [Hyphomicrobium sp.]MBY0559840.1 hypothetical protein [Hyphomicrobium sp.]